MVDQDLEDRLTDVNDAFKQLRDVINSSLDSSREMSLVLTKIDEAEMWAQKALNQ